MRPWIIVGSFFGVWIAGYAFGVQHLRQHRGLAVLFGLLCTLCLTGLGYTVYHHVFLAGPLDNWTLRRFLAYIITGLGVVSFGHLCVRAWTGKAEMATCS